MIPGITASRQAAGPTPGGDPYWAYVVSLIQGMTDIVDAKGNTIIDRNHNIVTSGGKIVFDGSIGSNQLNVLDDGVPGAWNLGTGAFCIEGYVSSVSGGYSLMWDTTNGNGSALNGFLFELSFPRHAYFLGGTGGYKDLQYLAFPLDGSEHHLCAMRDAAGNAAMGYDGVIVATNYAPSLNLDSAANYMSISNYGNSFPVALVGSLRGHRMTKGHNRYPTTLGATYDVPTMPLPTS